MNTIILVLGSTNDEKGNLSVMAQDRLTCAWQLAKENPTIKVICTGGFGERFNPTLKAHSEYGKQFLIGLGLKNEQFLPYSLSTNTIEDFKLALPILHTHNPDCLIIISSDFHMARVKLLAERILLGFNPLFISAKSSLSDLDLKPLILHEKKAISLLYERNFDF
ncbi:YdcF family protein [Sphingobacterium sp. HJSM2_6]|uniref:YdcF family protein n=1 Tax=Sphingobacterium sp. HJSM2_6 TaxID=3366264 RepID=UPI003BDF9767